MVGTVAEIWRYPVKSMAGERLDSCLIAESGLEGDRRWALVDGTPNRAGKPLTVREAEQLLTYRARLADGSVLVVTPGGKTRILDDVLLADLAAETARPLTLRDAAGFNYDDSPVLVVNLATVAAFELSAGVEVDRRRFRANLYLDGLEPEAELRWLGRRISAGDAELEVVSRCERCVVITRDPDTTQASPELLRVLTRTSDTCMGVYCRVASSGMVATGDPCGVALS
ncbi:MAG TPA: MOSC N-terminal beta barrel domain-containing protein [Candidatus Dormibacteraeota bacterium]